ncbi:amidohydrolase family protein [candidate division KSB1 bacterium]
MNDDLSRRDFFRTGLKISGAVAASAVAGKFAGCSFRPREFDIIIMNGHIIDGTGRPGFSGAVGIIGDTVAEVGNLQNDSAPVVIDAQSLIVAPGFINIHSHTGIGLLSGPEGMSSILQGVTTEVTGQDGSSAGPVAPDMLDENRRRNSERYGFDRAFVNVGDFLDLMETGDIGINIASMVGQGTIRDVVVGQSDREASPEEIVQMRRLVKEGIEGGAVGLSSGLEYTPGSFAKTAEIAEISRALKPFRLPYATHMRNEDNFLLEAIDETLTIGRDAECPVQISHLKVQGKPNWDKIDAVFEKIEQASDARGDVHFDRYPYVAYSTGLSNLFPTWAREGGTARFMERLQDGTLAARIREYVENKVTDLGSWNAVMISRAGNDDDRGYAGMRMDEIARDRNTQPYDETVAMLLRSRGSVGMVGFGMSEQNTERILSHPLGMICSDGSAMTVEGSGSPHPRSFGTFARVLGYYVRERKIFDLETAVHKMTLMPAEKLRLKGRGVIGKGAYADIVVFDPAAMQDNATFSDPLQYASGVSHVLVNGVIAVRGGSHTGALNGRVLRPGD